MTNIDVVAAGILVSLLTLVLVVVRELLVFSGRRYKAVDGALIILMVAFLVVAVARLQQLGATA